MKLAKRPHLCLGLGAVLVLIAVLFVSLPKTWIEDTFGFEPDGGNGALEVLLVLVPLVAGLILLAIALRELLRQRDAGIVRADELP